MPGKVCEFPLVDAYAHARLKYYYDRQLLLDDWRIYILRFLSFHVVTVASATILSSIYFGSYGGSFSHPLIMSTDLPRSRPGYWNWDGYHLYAKHGTSLSVFCSPSSARHRDCCIGEISSL
jgi:hypothetical protein